MAFIQIPPDQAGDGQIAELFADDQRRLGFVANYTTLFAHRPRVFAAWEQLKAAVMANMDPRRYELVTLAAARRMGSAYCSLAHGKVLRDRFYDAAVLRRIVTDRRRAGLDPRDVAVMDFAERVTADAGSVTATDVAALRAHGLSDGEILDVALAAALRCFFSKVVDAMGVEPDAVYRTDLEPELREVLTEPRPLALQEG
jgi:uncharacterized peroxidase-related enzyme